MNSMMNVGEVMNDRELVARILTNNLIKYGDILPDGFEFQATHGTEATSVVPMRRSNYLRYAAYLHEDSSHNPHFVSGDDLLRLNCSLKKGARPLYLESWYGSQEAGYSARLVEYYNVDDVEGEAPELDALKAFDKEQSQADRLDALRGHLSADPEFKPYDNESLSAATIREYMMHKLASRYQQDDENASQINAAVCQNLFHDYGISYFDKENPLFFDDEIQSFQKNPRQLFDVLMEASKRYSGFEKELAELQKNADLTQQAAPEPETPKEETAKDNAPFRTLKVHLDFANTIITHPLTGEVMAENGDATFTGEEAYLLLCAMLHEDKERFNDEKDFFRYGDGKASYSLEYGEGDDKFILGSNRHDLGYLEYGNRTSITDALKYVTKRPYEFLLDNPEKLNSYIGKCICDGADSEAKRKAYCQNKIKELDKAFQGFQDEEKAYLASQKEVDSYNHYKARLYTYICREEDLTDENLRGNHGNRKISKDLIEEILPADELKNYCVIPVGETFKKVCHSFASDASADTEYANYTELRNGLPSSMVAFTSTKPPTSDAICNKPLLNVMSADDLEIMKSIRDFNIKIEVIEKPAWQSYKDDADLLRKTCREYGFENGAQINGYKAIMTLCDLCEKEEKAYADAISSRIYFPGDYPTLKISYDFGDQKHPFGIYKWGTGELSGQATIGQNFGYKNEVPALVSKMRRSLYKIEHLTGDIIPRSFLESEQRIPQKLPDYEESLKTYHKQYPAPEIPISRPPADYYLDCYRYFRNEALLDPNNNYKIKVVQAATVAMARSGRNEAKIQSIANHLAQMPSYKEDAKEILNTLKAPWIKPVFAEAKKHER